MSNYKSNGFENGMDDVMEIEDMRGDAWQNWEKLKGRLLRSENIFKNTRMSEEKMRRIDRLIVELLNEVNDAPEQ